MYSHFQRFVATLLLFSILLQSCGNPNWKMVEPADAGSSGQTSKPKRLAPLQPTNQQEDAREGAMKVGSAPAIDRSSEASTEVASKADYVPPAASSRTAHRSSQLGSPYPTAARSLVVPASKAAQASRPSSVLKNPPTHEASKPQHAVPDKASVSQNNLQQTAQAEATIHPFRALQAAPQHTDAVHQLQPEGKPSANNAAAYQDSAFTALGHAPTQSYPSAQGHQVRFQEEEGKWQAQVEDVWGRVQELKVIFAPNTTPARALQQLSSKALAQHKYWVHVLETHQPPWAPRVVYVGALGLRGGGAVESPIDTTVTEERTLQKDTQQAYQRDQARDEKKKDSKQGAEIGAQDHHGRISGNLFESLKHIAKAITIPFDNRPLAPLTRAVDRICTQLKKGDLDTEQLDNSLRKGQKLMLEIAQQPYNASLDWQERIQYKTLADKLSCHVRLYQRLHAWAQDFTDADRQDFEAVIVPTLKQRFLRASTEIQQDLLNYWEHHGTCYADLLLEAPVQDWLKVSLHHDIVLAGLVNDDTLLQERFMQEVERLVQHHEGPTQQKLLTQLLWLLRARQQANQLDLLTLCEVTEWLPTDGSQSLHLLSNEAPDWYPAIKENWLLSRLAAFEDRYTPEAITKLCALLVRLPWNKTLTDSFLHAAAAEPDPIAFEHFLHFLEKYPLEDNLLLDTFYTVLPEAVASPCKRWHHTLACGLLREPLTKLFDKQADALHQQIAAWLPPRLGAYDALHTLLATLQAAEATQQARAAQALQLQKVFALLSDYGAATEACTDTFQSIAHQPASQWEAATHQLVVDATFHASHELETQEIIDLIAQNAPGVFFAGDAQQLQRSYDAIMATYQGPSQVLQQASPKKDGKEDEDEETTQHNAEAQQPIAHWSQETITKWARLVKNQHIPVTQNELLAVVKRAVALHHGFAPRTTQLLSVLTLLNTPERMGRLAQINTGEGKSLIVAMSAAVHALKGQKVDVVTTSVELSIPEVKKQAPFFTMLGLTAAENSKKNAADDEARHAIYQKDIVYGTAEDFQADIIQTQFFRRNIRGNRGFGVVLVDEVDSMLFDDRSYSTQLSSLTPAMNHLEVVLGTTWCQINLIASRLRTIDGQDYLILTDQFKDLPDGGIVLPEGKTLAECSRPVDDQLGFLKEKTIEHLETILRKLTPEDRKNLAAYKAQEQRVQDLSKKVQQDEKKHKEEQEDLEKEHKKEQEHREHLYRPYSSFHSLHYGNYDDAMHHHLCRKAESIVLREKQKQYFFYKLDWSDKAAIEEKFNVLRKEALDTLKKNHKEALDALKKNHKEQEEASKATLQAAIEALRKEPWSQEAEYLEIPVHLQDFARTQISNWVESAITALLRYKKNQHYYVRGGKIMVVDYGNTGVLQHNTVLENGLTQFLQIKEGLKVTPEGISTNSISKPGYFKKYGGRLYGLTGTLGNATTHKFLTDMYGVDMVTIPPYKHREISGNENSRYLCKELLPTLVTTPEAWYDAIMESVLRAARHGQAVLVICNYIDQVHHLQERLAAEYEAKKVFVYTGEKTFERPQVDMGEIVLGTNIAGRGTDLTTSTAVENHGGLHVCITFLPPSYRVELQNAGRTARQGKKGTAQLVLRTANEETLQTLRTNRDERENKAIEKARRDVDNMLTADRLFMRYCGVEASFFPTMEAVAKMKLSQGMLATCQLKEETLLSSGALSASYENQIQQHVQTLLLKVQEPDSWRNYTTAQLLEERNKLKQAFRVRCMQRYSLEKHREARKAKLQEEHIRNYEKKVQQDLPADVAEAFLNGQVYVPPGSDLVSKYNWAEAERHGSQERWGIWLKEDRTEKDTDSKARHRRFDGLEKELKSDAQADKLIKNPYYYVEKGNKLRRSGLYRLAAKAFGRAIDLDPPYSSIARFNKAMALVSLTSNKHNQSEAKHELEKAQDLVKTHDKGALLSFDTLVGQTGKKPRTSEHVQHQLDILSQLENYIANAISVIEGAQEEDLDVEITEIQSLQEVFKDAEGDRSQAFREATANGLTHVFSIKVSPPPTPWWSIVAVALIGLAQITAGVFLSACTLGAGLTFAKGLISEGISDLITAVKSGIQGSFSWAEWALQKAISLAVSLISAGWDAIKNGCAAIKETAQNVGRAATELGKKGVNVALQRVGVELGKGVAKECANALVNYGVDELLIKNIEKKIEKDVTEKIMHSLAQSTLVQAALALDVKTNSNYWQNLLQQEGMALLATTKDNKVLYALKEIAKGVASNKIKGADAVLKGAAMAKAMVEVLTFTDKFLEDFHRKLEQTYKDKIKKAETTQKETEQQQAAQQQEKEQQQTHQQVASAPPLPTDEEDIAIPVITMQEDYQSDLRDYYYEKPSSNQGLGHTLSRTITSSMTQKIQGEVIRPATGALVNWGIDKMLEKVEKAVQKSEEDFCIEGRVYYESNNTANESKKDGKKDKQKSKVEDNNTDKKHHQQEGTHGDKVTGNEQSPSSEPKKEAQQPISEANEAMAQEVRDGKKAGIAEIGAASAALKQPVAIYDEKGRLLEIVGRGHKGKPLKVQHIPSADGSSDHYVPYGTKTTAAVSGATNCAYDALACQTDKVGSGAALREQVADRLATSTNTTALHKATERLRAHNPRALREGGGLHQAMMKIQRDNPHSSYNQDRLVRKNSDYAALRAAAKAAKAAGDKRGDEAKSKALAAQLREMEVKAHTERHEAQRQQVINTFHNVYHVGRGLGTLVTNPPLSIMLNEQQITGALCDVAYFGRGAGNALGNNLTLGAIPRDHWSHPAFVRGQRFGDGLSIGLGAAESWLGRGMMGGGGLMMVTSGGALVPVAAPFAASGAAVASHGGVVMGKAMMEFKGKDGGNKQSGKGDPHANPDAKSKAQSNYEKLKAELAKYKAESRGKPGRQKEIKRLEGQVKHWKKQADFKGETHSKTPKGN